MKIRTWSAGIAVPLLLGSLAWSILHVAGMVALRKAAYASVGDSYDFTPWWWEFGYEYLKDVRSYAGVVLTIEGYRLLLRRLQGEAMLLAARGEQRRLLAIGAEHVTLDIGRKSLLTLRHLPTLRRLFAEVGADIVHARSRLPAWLGLWWLLLPLAALAGWLYATDGRLPRRRAAA